MPLVRMTACLALLLASPVRADDSEPEKQDSEKAEGEGGEEEESEPAAPAEDAPAVAPGERIKQDEAPAGTPSPDVAPAEGSDGAVAPLSEVQTEVPPGKTAPAAAPSGGAGETAAPPAGAPAEPAAPAAEPASPAAPRKTRLLVLNLRSERGLDDGLIKLLNELLMTEFQKSEQLDVFGEQDLMAMVSLEVTRQQLTGCTDDSCLAEVGGALGVDQLVFSNVGQVGARYILNMKLLDVTQARVIGRISEFSDSNEDALVYAIQKASAQLCGRPAPEPPQPPALEPAPAPAPEPEPEPEVAAVAVEPAPEPGQAPPEETGTSGMAVGAWVLLGVGVAALATGTGFGVVAKQEQDRMESRTFKTQSGYDDAVDAVNTNALVADVSFGVGGAAVAAGLILFLVDALSGEEPGEEPAVSIAPAASEGGGSLILEGRF